MEVPLAVAKAAPASNQIPSVAASTRAGDGSGSAASSMPITAQNSASCVTRGLVNCQYCRAR